MDKKKRIKSTRRNKSEYGFLKRFLAIMLLLVFIVVGVDLLVVSDSSGRIFYGTRGRLITQQDVAGMKYTPSADCILILGCGIIDEETPCAMLRDRLEAGAAAYRLGLAPRILISGDNGHPGYNEIHVMLHYLLNAGIPGEDIFCDHLGFSTYDSVHRAKSVFGADEIIVVTQKYHLYRALYIASGLDIDAVGICSNQRKYIGNAYREVREILARDKDYVKTLIKAAPENGGTAISLLESGKISWEESELK